MSEKLPGEIISPMISDGVLYWCLGDTFRLSLVLNLYALGEKYLLSETDSVEVSFFDKSEYCVYKFYASAENGNCITLEFDETTTSAFDKGRYTYDICIITADGIRTTVANDNLAIVV